MSLRGVDDESLRDFDDGSDSDIELEDMMGAEGIRSLEIDKRTNTLTIKDSDTGAEVSLTMDLVRAFEKKAEDDSSDVFVVMEE